MLYRKQGSAFGQSGDQVRVLPFAQVKVLDKNGALASIFSDASGTTALANPISTTRQGAYDFYVIVDDFYDMIFSKSGESEDERFYPIDLATLNASVSAVKALEVSAQAAKVSVEASEANVTTSAQSASSSAVSASNSAASILASEATVTGLKDETIVARDAAAASAASLSGSTDQISTNNSSLSTYADLTPAVGITVGGYVAITTGAVVTSASYKYAYFTVEAGKLYKLSGQPNGGTTALATWIDAADNVISFDFVGEGGGSSATTYIDKEIIAPAGAVKLGMSQNVNRSADFGVKGPTFASDIAPRVVSLETLPAKTTALENVTSVGRFSGSTLGVIGTSIEWGQADVGGSWPMMFAALTDMTLTNYAEASLIFRAGYKSAVDVAGGDPYGWFGARANQVARSLMQTIVQKQFLIDNWSTFYANFSEVGSWPATLSSAEEAEILAYSYENKLSDILAGNAPDYIIIAGCYNDRSVVDDIATEDGDSGSGEFEDTNTYRGAMNKLIRLIMENNRDTRIVMAEHFENTHRTTISQAQNLVTERWSIPFLDAANSLGWSNVSIEWNGNWSENNASSFTWVDGGSNIDTVRERYVPGGVHPYFDASGAANMAYARAILGLFMLRNF